MVPGEQSVGSARMTLEVLWVLVLVSPMPTYVPTGREYERSWGILQAVGKADLIAKTTEIKGSWPGSRRGIWGVRDISNGVDYLLGDPATEPTRDKLEEDRGHRDGCEPQMRPSERGRKPVSSRYSLSTEPSSNLPRKHWEGTDFTATFQ